MIKVRQTVITLEQKSSGLFEGKLGKQGQLLLTHKECSVQCCRMSDEISKIGL